MGTKEASPTGKSGQMLQAIGGPQKTEDFKLFVAIKPYDVLNS